MYVRRKTIRRRDKVYTYYQLVEGVRVGELVRQRVVKHLGPQPSREHADMVARLSGLLCPVLECGNRPTVEHSVQAAILGDERARITVCAEHSGALDRGDTVRAYT